MEGGDFLPTASVSMPVSDEPGTEVIFSSAEMAADVQQWLSDAESNHGWIVIDRKTSPTLRAALSPLRETRAASGSLWSIQQELQSWNGHCFKTLSQPVSIIFPQTTRNNPFSMASKTSCAQIASRAAGIAPCRIRLKLSSRIPVRIGWPRPRAPINAPRVAVPILITTDVLMPARMETGSQRSSIFQRMVSRAIQVPERIHAWRRGYFAVRHTYFAQLEANCTEIMPQSQVVRRCQRRNHEYQQCQRRNRLNDSHNSQYGSRKCGIFGCQYAQRDGNRIAAVMDSTTDTDARTDDSGFCTGVTTLISVSSPYRVFRNVAATSASGT